VEGWDIRMDIKFHVFSFLLGMVSAAILIMGLIEFLVRINE